MVTANKVLNIARDEIGYKIPRGYPSKYGEWYGEPGFEKSPYCAMFVSWVFAQAGMSLHPIQNKNGFAYCPYGLRWFRDNGQLRRTPCRGDIVFFDWGGDGVSDHVGIVEEVYPTYLKTIEGNTSYRNQSNGRYVMSRVRYFPSCCGFARPNYEGQDLSWNGFYLELTKPYTKRTEVGFVQKALNALGSSLDVDNIYGKNTLKEVLRYQVLNELHADGVVGAETWGKLVEDYQALNTKPN